MNAEALNETMRLVVVCGFALVCLMQGLDVAAVTALLAVVAKR